MMLETRNATVIQAAGVARMRIAEVAWCLVEVLRRLLNPWLSSPGVTRSSQCCASVATWMMRSTVSATLRLLLSITCQHVRSISANTSS